jgi:hypothetical protein
LPGFQREKRLQLSGTFEPEQLRSPPSPAREGGSFYNVLVKAKILIDKRLKLEDFQILSSCRSIKCFNLSFV